MGQWHGRYFRGAMRVHRATKRDEAAERDKLTRPERRKAYRLGPLNRNGVRTRKSIRRYLLEEKRFP
jgi:hypothetical protein